MKDRQTSVIMLNSKGQQKRFDGVVGYRICLTHRRPPVRARVEPFFIFSSNPAISSSSCRVLRIVLITYIGIESTEGDHRQIYELSCLFTRRTGARSTQVWPA